MGVPGVWSVELPLRQGRHEYAFVVLDTTGERWVADPLAPRVRDEFGTESSVVTVKPRPAS
jgi:1,4-alpha-glucan branching enzyme